MEGQGAILESPRKLGGSVEEVFKYEAIKFFFLFDESKLSFTDARQ